MTVGVNIHWTFRVIASDTDLFEVGDQLTEALLEQERVPGVLDSTVSVDRGKGTVEIEVTASGQSRDEAVTVGQAAITAAIEAAGGRPASMLPTGLETQVMALA
ncbi:MAG: hypothetical protein ACRDSL_04360 [Pseudonocardiaceae bacterium]